MEEKVILVDESDREVGVENKMDAHLKGILHRAFSIFIFNSKDEMLLQKRAKTKYHSGGLWSNTCCGHPRPGESTQEAAHRRLREEMGFDCRLKQQFSFTYISRLDNDLVEHEYDHVLTGKFDGQPIPEAKEVESWCWVNSNELEDDITRDPNKYTVWFVNSVRQVTREILKVKL
jgi:isopentenyl-diphosphate delta-isomerase